MCVNIPSCLWDWCYATLRLDLERVFALSASDAGLDLIGVFGDVRSYSKSLWGC